MPGKTHEHTFNVALGEALKEINMHGRHQQRTGDVEGGVRPYWINRQRIINVEKQDILAGKDSQKRIDILIEDQGFNPVAIETAFDRTGADKDARSRVKGKIKIERGGSQILAAIAVKIPERYQRLDFGDIKEAILSGRENLFYALYQYRQGSIQRWPPVGFLEGSIFDLENFFTIGAIPKEQTEAVALEVANSVGQAASCLSSLPQERQIELSELIGQQTLLQNLQTIALLWLNACFVQYQLGKQGTRDIPPLPRENEIDPGQLISAWKKILKYNWHSIFEPAVQAFEKTARFDERTAKEAIALLVKAVRYMDQERLGLHINIGAELFPKLSHDRKTAAAFYTQPATAELLARLTVREKDLKASAWASDNFFEQHFLADLACGTGTLLRAGYKRIEQLYKKHARGRAALEKIHLQAMESGLIGVDISPLAAHLATSSLAVIGYGEPYGETRIGWVNVGGERGETGAVEYLGVDVLYDLFQDVGSRKSFGTKREKVEKHSIQVANGKIDWLLMNPPYSRTRGGQSVFDLKGLDEQERKRCQERWGQLTRNLNMGEYVNRQAGMAATFLLLAKRKVKPAGRIGFVLPLTAAFSDVWAPTRKMLRQNFKDITAIAVLSGQASGTASLSADTDIEEMLLVATRNTGLPSNKPASVCCVTLYSAFPRIGEATEIARAIESGLDELEDTRPVKVGEKEIAQLMLFDGELEAPWSLLSTGHSDLAFAAQALCAGTLSHLIDAPIALGIEMGTFETLFDVGPTHDLIGHLEGKDARGAFEFHEITSRADAIGRDRSLWKADSKMQKHIVVQPTHKGIRHKKASSKEREAMREHQSSLFYARNMRWTSQALLATTTKYPVHGGPGWVALKHQKADVQKMFALWANSTFGLVIHWTQGQRTQLGRSRTQIGALRKIPCPRFDLLPEDILTKAAQAFDKFSSKELLPTCQAHADDTRKAIDELVIRLLQLEPKADNFVFNLRNLWCQEPSVHGNNKKALERLSSMMTN